MAIAMFSIVIAIAICHVPLVVIASVEVRATPAFRSAIIGIAVASSQSGAVASRVAAPNSGSATAFKAAGRTIAAAPETWAATVASAPKGAAASAAAAAVTAATAAATQRAAAAAVTAATTAAGATASTTPTSTSTASTAFAGKIDKVGAGVG
jgi:hypothetical protein